LIYLIIQSNNRQNTSSIMDKNKVCDRIKNKNFSTGEQKSTEVSCQKDSHKRRNSSQSSNEEVVLFFPKRPKKPSFIVKNREMTAFFKILGRWLKSNELYRGRSTSFNYTKWLFLLWSNIPSVINIFQKIPRYTVSYRQIPVS